MPVSRSTLYAATDDGVWVRAVAPVVPTATPVDTATPSPTVTPEPARPLEHAGSDCHEHPDRYAYGCHGDSHADKTATATATVRERRQPARPRSRRGRRAGHAGPDGQHRRPIANTDTCSRRRCSRRRAARPTDCAARPTACAAHAGRARDQLPDATLR